MTPPAIRWSHPIRRTPRDALNIKVDAWNDVTHISDTSGTVNVCYCYDGLHNMIVETNTLAPAGTVSTTDFYYSGQQLLEAEPRLPSSPTAYPPPAVAHQWVNLPRYVDSPILDTQTTYTVVSGSWSSAVNLRFLDGCQL